MLKAFLIVYYMMDLKKKNSPPESNFKISLLMLCLMAISSSHVEAMWTSWEHTAMSRGCVSFKGFGFCGWGQGTLQGFRFRVRFCKLNFVIATQFLGFCFLSLYNAGDRQESWGHREEVQWRIRRNIAPIVLEDSSNISPLHGLGLHNRSMCA